MLVNIIIAIIVGVLIFFGLKYILWPLLKMLVRYLFVLVKWLLFSIPILIILLFSSIDIEAIYILASIAGMAGIDFFFKLKKGKNTTYAGTHYVLNTKSKIAHRPWDSSVNDIGSNHRKDVYATESELFREGYRKKKDS